MKLVVFIVLCLFVTPALAQMNPGAMSFVGGGPASSSDDLDSSRYVKKPSAHKKSRRPASERPDYNGSNDSQGPEADLQNAQVAPLPRLGADSYSAQAVPQPMTPAPTQPNPSFGNKMRDMFLGGDPEMIDQYRAFLDTEDIRKNLFEFTLATTYVYNTSISPYFFRNYIDSSPGAYVGLDLWLTPFLGIDADYRGTFLDTIKDSPTQENYVGGTQTWFDLGLRFRRFFGLALNASSLTVALKYSDYVFAVPPSSQSRMRIHNQAPELSIDAAVPASRYFSWTMGLSIEPFVSSTEIMGSTNLSSGQSNQTVGYGASFGGEYRMSRQTRAFFKLSAELYKSQFSGQASGLDPVTGTSPTGIPVTNVFYMLDLGVRLGR